MLAFVLIIIAVILIIVVRRKFKYPKVGAMAMVTGGVKCGKSTFAVGLTISEYKRRKRGIKIKNFFRTIFGKEPFDLPLIYSNIPLSVPYVPITQNLLLRKQRFVYGSVIYINEASLVADSQLIKDMDINECLLLFNKLIGHETLGGCIIYDTQSIADVHYSIKRCLSNYFYIHHLYKWLPFFLVATVRECRYSDDGSVVSVETSDTEDNLKRVIIRKSVWKKFDAYCFSSLTDDLPVANFEIISENLKVNKVFSFRQYRSIPTYSGRNYEDIPYVDEERICNDKKIASTFSYEEFHKKNYTVKEFTKNA